ncbi:MAG: leucine-rich repeat protein [Verrucomicrobia bacterium]|nr:leucine-rich repeat protein [Verrucomicrobiota bacterium]
MKALQKLWLLLWLALPAAVQAQFTYITNNGGTISITGAYDYFENPIIIPDTINGLPVTHIGEYAFASVNAPGVTIPDSVVDVGPYAFHNSALSSVTIGNGVTNIGVWAFAESSGITNITFGNNVATIGESAFRGVFSLAGIVFPNSVTSLGDSVLADSEHLTAITLGNNVTNIGSRAFWGCYALTNIAIPASVIRIGEFALYACTSLTEMTVAPLNPSYFSSNGVLFSTSPMSLIQYPIHKPETDYRIPGGVTRIETYAFSWTLASVIFEGDAPATEGFGPFWGPEPVIYYFAGTSGWSNTWQGLPAIALNPPYFSLTLQPTNQTVNSGATASLAVNAAGSGPLSYQWRLNGAAIAGATANVYTLSPALTNQAGSYDVVITNLHGGLTSAPAVLTVVYTPTITGQPTNRTAFVGQTVVIRVGAYGALPLSYQWSFNGTNIDGATNAALMLPGVQSADAGAYAVVVSNFVDSVTSSTAVLTVNPPPLCVTQPSGLVSWWRAESAPVDEMERNPGTVAGWGAVGYGPGVAGQAFVFDGTHRDRVNLGNPTNLQLQDFTIEAWVKRSDAAQVSFDDDHGDGGNTGQGGLILSYGRGGYGFGVYNDGRMVLSRIDVSGVTSSPLVADTDWHHLAVTKSGTNVVFYMDGAPEAAPGYDAVFTFDNGSCACGAAVSIGSRGDARGGSFYGAIDEPAIYSRALSDGEIFAIYNAWSSGKCVAQVPPFITTQPTNQTVASGRTATFRVTAGGTTPLSYQWRLNGGDVAGATADVYTLFPALTNHAGSYTVLVTNSYGSITSAPAVFTVIEDTSRPRVAIASPAAGARVTNNPALTVRGTAGDNIGVAQVLYQLGGGAFVPATGTSNWSLALTLTPGLNTVRVKSVDWSGNISPTNARNFFLLVTNPFTLFTNGSGYVSSTVSPIGTPTNGASLDVGCGYTVTAVSGSNYIFSNWLASANGGPTVVATNTAKYTFLMQTNLTLTAQFAANRFLDAAGSYNGLFSDTNNGVDYRSAGFATVKVMAKQGKLATFSASLSFAGQKASFAGTLDLEGNGVSRKPVTLKTDLNTIYKLALNLPSDGPMTGSLSNLNAGWSAALLAEKQDFIPGYAGQYTGVLPGSTNPAVAPGGDGYGLVTVDTNGIIKLTGALGDGTVISQKVPVGANGDWPLFASVYAATNNGVKVKGGVLLGWLNLVDPNLYSLHLIKTAIPGVMYPNGFTNDFVPLTSTYTNLALSTNRVIELTSGSDGVVILSGGDLPANITNLVSLSLLNMFTAPATNTAGGTNKLMLSVKTATGKLTGTFKTNGVTATAFSGAVLQNTNIGRGYFKTATNSGAFRLQGR